MDDWSEADLAWELADAISPVLAERDRGQVYATIGSGDSYAAIDTMLQEIARRHSSVPPELIAKLANWLYAYTLSDDAQRLQKLVRVTTAPR